MVNSLKPLAQYIKDLSFENYAAQRNNFVGEKLNLNIDLKINKKTLKKDIIEVSLLVLLEAKTDQEIQFLIELTYGSTFIIQKNQNLKDIKRLTFVDCPTIMFPFIRQIIFNISQDSGFLPINLEYIDFNNLYESQKTN